MTAGAVEAGGSSHTQRAGGTQFSSWEKENETYSPWHHGGLAQQQELPEEYHWGYVWCNSVTSHFSFYPDSTYSIYTHYTALSNSVFRLTMCCCFWLCQRQTAAIKKRPWTQKGLVWRALSLFSLLMPIIKSIHSEARLWPGWKMWQLLQPGAWKRYAARLQRELLYSS